MVGTAAETSYTSPPSITTTAGPGWRPGTQARPTRVPASPSAGRLPAASNSRLMVMLSHS